MKAPKRTRSLSGPKRDRFIAREIAAWFASNARDLPWRVTPRDPYLSLISEFMLQQTQVSRVLEKFPLLVRRFPTLASLAAAPEDDVLALWSGMGYYRRARSLHAAARAIVEKFDGGVPEEVKDLLTLPGVGRYTAGAISSIAFDRPEPIVDGNVARVLMRIEGKLFQHGSPDGQAWAWKEAERLIAAAATARVSPAALNEGLMELGALVCTPRSPRCGVCPVKGLCAALASGHPERIPRPKPAARRQSLYCEVVVVRDRRGRTLLEQRPANGMWAGLWQAPTWERSERAARPSEVAQWIGLPRVSPIERFTFLTTHREVQFSIWSGVGLPRAGKGRSFVGSSRIESLALSNPQRRVLLKERGSDASPPALVR